MKNELSSMEKVPLNRILVYRFPSYATYIPDERLDKWENMILIPHEWWKHKNHLGLLGFMEINTSYCFIFTGNTRTEDTNGTFYNFERLAKEKGLTNYRVLGVVSHEYLMTLFNQSAVVVNVSLNEGWNTSVEMGKSLGKTLLLSKIKVHEEQVANYPNVIWFNKGLHLKGTQVLEKASQFNYNDEVEGNLARFNADIAQIAK